MKKLIALAPLLLLAACSSTEVNLTVDNQTNGTVSAWVDRSPDEMIDLGIIAPGDPTHRHFEAETGRRVSVYVDNVKLYDHVIAKEDPDPLPVTLTVKK
jgi:hypothetical protein